MNKVVRSIVACLALAALAGCQKKAGQRLGDVAGEQGRGNAMLAYQHVVQINLPEVALAARIADARAACESARFGACNVLGVREAAHHAELDMRIVPQGVTPMVALAAKDATIDQRETHAEDLAEQIDHTREERERLERYAQQLDRLSSTKAMATADLIALAHEQASVETQRQELVRNAVNQQRRLDTNRLELQFTSSEASQRMTRLRASMSEIFDRAAEGVGDAVGLLAYGVPFLVLAFPLAMLWRVLWRRATRPARRDP